MNYAILDAVYDFKLFEDTIEEYIEKEYITWETRLTGFNEGDVVFIKYSGLPMETQARLLFRGEVLDSGLKMTRHEIYDDNDDTIVKAIKLTNLKVISFSDTEKYTDYELKTRYNVRSTRGGVYLYDTQQDLIDAIENSSNELSPLVDSLNYFKEKIKAYNDSKVCSCGKNHPTFIRTDGTKYFEVHHLIPQSTIKQFGLSSILVDAPDNKYLLCSNCHNEIHYGLQERKRNLLKKLYSSNKDWYDINFKKYSGKMSVIDWIFKLYNVEAIKNNNQDKIN